LLSKAKILRSGELLQFGMPSFEKRLPVVNGAISSRPSAEEVERVAYEKGFAAGERAGMEMGEQRVTVLLERIERIIAEMESFSEMMQKEIEPQVIELSREIAERIVMEELSLRPEVMVNIVKEAMRKLERTGPLTIKLNPAVHDLFMKLRPGLLEVHPDIIFDIDPSLTQTGQVVIGASEEVVTDIESQVRNIMDDIGGSSGNR